MTATLTDACQLPDDDDMIICSLRGARSPSSPPPPTPVRKQAARVKPSTLEQSGRVQCGVVSGEVLHPHTSVAQNEVGCVSAISTPLHTNGTYGAPSSMTSGDLSRAALGR